MSERKIKIAILSFYSTLVSRGVETFVTELSAKVKDEVDLTFYHADKLPGQGNKLSYLFLDPPSLAIKRFTQKTLQRLKADPPEVIMALNNGWMSLLTKFFCRQHKTKLILAGFSGIGWDDKVNLYLNPDCFVACTKFQETWARNINPKVRIETINIGVNTERFVTVGSKYDHGLKSPVILVVAGPQATKRVHLAIEAVSRLPKISLLVVGEQPKAILDLGRNKLKNRFKNLMIDYSHLDSVYRSVQAFSLPSVASEAYGISILEALSSGLPVVVNDDPIRRELVGKAGILTNPSDINAYAAALDKAVKSANVNLSRSQAEKFSWSQISQQYLNLWSSLSA